MIYPNTPVQRNPDTPCSPLRWGNPRRVASLTWCEPFWIIRKDIHMALDAGENNARRGRLGCTHDLACHSQRIIDFASLQSRGRGRRVPAGSGSQSITKREAPWCVRRAYWLSYVWMAVLNDLLHFLVSLLSDSHSLHSTSRRSHHVNTTEQDHPFARNRCSLTRPHKMI